MFAYITLRKYYVKAMMRMEDCDQIEIDELLKVLTVEQIIELKEYLHKVIHIE